MRAEGTTARPILKLKTSMEVSLSQAGRRC
jgi:hypothetical protein